MMRPDVQSPVQVTCRTEVSGFAVSKFWSLFDMVLCAAVLRLNPQGHACLNR